MPASGPRARGASVHPRPCQGDQPWLRTSAAPGLVLATQKLDGITGRGTSALDHVLDAPRALLPAGGHRLRAPGPDARPPLAARAPVADGRVPGRGRGHTRGGPPAARALAAGPGPPRPEQRQIAAVSHGRPAGGARRARAGTAGRRPEAGPARGRRRGALLPEAARAGR